MSTASEILNQIRNVRPRRKLCLLNDAANNDVWLRDGSWVDEPATYYEARRWVFEDGSVVEYRNGEFTEVRL